MSRKEQGGVIGLLQQIFTDLPKLTGAACIGQHQLFDERGPGESTEAATERHARAIALCQQCPALDACAAFAATEKDAGQVRAGILPRIKETTR